MNEVPKAFISYAWSSAEHMEWVLRLASDLRESGVDVQLDKWNLKEGHDANAFMEQMVTDEDISKVIIVCDRIYAEKADKKEGGVGTESQIMSPAIYGSVTQDKFAAVAVELDDNKRAILPTFLQSRIYIDMAAEERYETGLEQLLRWCFGKPLHVPPELGTPPVFDQQVGVGLRRKSAAVQRTAANPAISNDAVLRAGLETLEEFVINNRFLTPEFEEDEVWHETMYKYIKSLRPVFDDLLNVVDDCLKVDESCRTENFLHKFFELLLPGLSSENHPRKGNSFNSFASDAQKFFANYMFVQTFRLILDHRKFACTSKLLDLPYVNYRHDNYTAESKHFTVFNSYLESLDRRNRDLSLRRLSLHADLINEFCADSRFGMGGYMEADFILWLRSYLDPVDRFRGWWPVSNLYAAHSAGAFPIFLRARDPDTLNGILQVLGVASLRELKDKLSGNQVAESIPKWEFERIDLRQLMDAENLFRDLD